MGSNVNGAPEIRRVLDSLRRIVQALRRAAAVGGLPPAQLFILHRLGESASRGEGGLSINELAHRTHTHQSSVSGVAARLVEAKLVRRQKAASDGRRVELSLTTAGRAKLRRSPLLVQDQLLAALKRMKSRDRSELARLLDALVEGIVVEAGPVPLFFEEARKAKKGRKNVRASS